MSANRRSRRSARKPTAHQRRTERRRAAAAALSGSASAGDGPDRGRAKRGGRRPQSEGRRVLGNEGGTVRRSVERRSLPFLFVLHRMPRWLVPLLMAVLFAAGVLLPGVAGVVCLGVLFAFLSWLSYLSWPVVKLGGRLARLGMLGSLVVIAVLHLLGRI